MNKQYGTSLSLTGPKVHLRTTRYRRPRLNRPQRQNVVSTNRLNVEAFEQFLGWLGPDPEAAGRKYESIRHRLITMFRARRCIFAEDLADVTIERVARKLDVLSTRFTGDPARYFFGVAKKIYLEHQQAITAAARLRSEFSPPAQTEDHDLEDRLKQLDEALATIPSSDRELILGYYTGTGHNKISHRRALAEKIGIRPNALRLRVFRIRREIKNYMLRSNVRCAA
ncbi:MAG TPA: hypothetical protein VFX63_06430 [Pyrinomonadaceae bacterium]|nr:hypothetical protein [Pyrinomonadaceae bacterium]